MRSRPASEQTGPQAVLPYLSPELCWEQPSRMAALLSEGIEWCWWAPFFIRPLTSELLLPCSFYLFTYPSPLLSFSLPLFLLLSFLFQLSHPGGSVRLLFLPAPFPPQLLASSLPTVGLVISGARSRPRAKFPMYGLQPGCYTFLGDGSLQTTLWPCSLCPTPPSPSPAILSRGS